MIGDNVQQILKEKGVLISQVKGESMLPMLKPNVDTVVIASKPEKIKKYDVVLVLKRQQLVLHRITKVLKKGYLFVGDNTIYREIVLDEQIIGILKEFYSDNKLISVEDKKYKRYAFFRVKTYYIRKIFYKIKMLFKKGKGKK